MMMKEKEAKGEKRRKKFLRVRELK